MEFDSKDNDVVKLLTKLKNANGTYPQELLALRRQGYLKQVAEISGGVGLALGLRNTVKSAGGSSGATTTGTLLEILLVAAIVAEASTVAFLYRDKLADLFRTGSNTPGVEEVSNPPVVTSPIPEFELTISPVVTETETPVGTPSLELAVEPTDQGNSQGSGSDQGGSQAVSTPNPDDNNGNQYGLTPKPERTREPGNNSENNPDSQAESKRRN